MSMIPAIWHYCLWQISTPYKRWDLWLASNEWEGVQGYSDYVMSRTCLARVSSSPSLTLFIKNLWIGSYDPECPVASKEYLRQESRSLHPSASPVGNFLMLGRGLQAALSPVYPPENRLWLPLALKHWEVLSKELGYAGPRHKAQRTVR